MTGDSVAVGKRQTGSQTFMTAAELPVGWVQVTYFFNRDDPDFYAGPLLSETADVIELEVYGEPLRFWKQNCIIDRPKSSN